jgi:acyl-CoA hydrolase
MPRRLKRGDLAGLVRRGETVFVAGATGEPSAILAAWREERALADVTLIGVPIPGLNRFAPEAFSETCRLRTDFLTRDLRPAMAKGLVDHLPMHHSDFAGWLAGDAPIDAAVFQVAPPDGEGRCDLGPCADFLPLVLQRRGIRLIAQINHLVPPCRDGFSIPFESLDAVYTEDTDLPAVPPESEVASPIAEHAASLVDDGSVVQVGIGRLPDHVLRKLADRKQLVLHGGTVTPAGLALLEGGSANTIVAGIAVGDAGFYRQVAKSPKVAFRPVTYTHREGLVGRHRFVALNSALEVDLFGQVNSELSSEGIVAAFGGVNDFLRAAHMSPGGRAVVMLAATGRKGAVSRIVPRIDGSLVSVQRGDIDTVVTEHGVADLRGLDLDRRAEALVAIAAPQFREGLAAEWMRTRSRLA